jgi:alkanesulfonate monooxygenase
MAPDAIEKARADFLSTQSVGQRRQFDLHGGDVNKLEIYPNVWAGIGLVRGGVGTALVGSYEEVADRIVEYHNLGIEAFIMSGYPHLEEAYWFGEGVMPILRERGYLPALEGGPTKVFSFR